MTQKNNKGFQTVEQDVDELEQRLIEHKKKRQRKIFGISGLVFFVILVTVLWNLLMTYESFEVQDSVDYMASSVAKYTEFQNNMITYSNDGISCRNHKMELLWNQSYEMSNPQVYICEKYLVVFDQGGTSLYIIGERGIIQKIETATTIQKACIASQGTVALLLKEDMTSYVKLYDVEGKELVGGEFYGEKASIPIDIAFSYDAQKLGIDFVDLSKGKLQTTIAFYNFGSVGQNEIDNRVGSYTYDNVFVSKLLFVSDKRMIAFAERKLMLFEGSQKPELKKEVELPHELQSVFYDNKYIGMIYANEADTVSYHVEVYDFRGNKVMEKDTDFAYEKADFIKNHEVCLLNSNQCELITIHGVSKFRHTFEEEIYKVYSIGCGKTYLFIHNKRADEVKLK